MQFFYIIKVIIFAQQEIIGMMQGLPLTGERVPKLATVVAAPHGGTHYG